MPLPPKGSRTVVAGVRAAADDPAQKLFGHLAAVPAGAFLEGAADPRHVPGVALGGEAVLNVLRAENPGVVGKTAFGVGPGVEVDQLPRRGNADGLVVESKTFGVLHEIKQVGMTAAELPGAVDPKRIVPDHPVSQRQPELAVEEDLHLGGILVADRQPERAVGLECTDDLATPRPGPVEVGLRFKTVVVDIVIIADVERGIGENQIDRSRRNPWEQLQAVSRVQSIELQGPIADPARESWTGTGGTSGSRLISPRR